jgi:S1-C subfamily serine protease
VKLYFDGPGGTREIEVDRELSLGRGPDNDVVLDDSQVSRRHALVRPMSGRIEIQDLDSYNGTFVNGQRLTKPAVVSPGDSVLFGETTATVQEEQPAAAAQPPLAPAYEPAPTPPAFEPPPPPVYEPPPPPAYEPPPPPVYEPPPPPVYEPPPPPPEPAVRAPSRNPFDRPAARDPFRPAAATPPPPPPPPPAYEPPPPQEAATAVMHDSFGAPPQEHDAATMLGGNAWTPPAPARIPRLVVRTGRDEGKELALMEGVQVTIGRESTSTFVLTDPRISSHHARVYLQGGRLIIEDSGSANGTFVNGARVTAPMAAEEESEIQVGESILTFTRQPSSFFAGAPSPTLVGARIDSAAEVERAVEEAVARSERKGRRREYMLAGGGVVAATALVLALLWQFGVFDQGDGQPDGAEVSEDVRAAVVRIDSYDNDGFPVSGGSGSIIDLNEGLVLTNNHVGSVGHLEVVNSVNNESTEAVLLAAAPCDDLALVAVDGLRNAASGLKQVEFGNSTELRQGDDVIALGYPGAAEQFLDRALSHTEGVVSKVKTVYDQPGSGLPFLQDVIQTDAAINPGNSGGPLFDFDGRQIGVNTARFTGPAGAQSENYAVSINRVQELLGQLRSGVSPKWIGATFDELINTQTGEPAVLAVADVTPGGPAEQIGLAGPSGNDYQFYIVGIDGTEVATLHDYCDAMPETGTVTLTVYVVADDEFVDVEIEVGGFGE